MKKLFILFSFIFCVSGWGQDHFNYNDFIEISNPNKVSLYRDASALARQLLEEASKTPDVLNDAGIAMARAVKQKLNSVIFMEPVRDDISSCGPKEQMFVKFSYINNIFSCPHLYTAMYTYYKTKKSQKEALAQLLIHEGTHLVQEYRNECDATELEIRIMNATVGVKSWFNVDQYRAKPKETANETTTCSFKFIQD